MPQVKSSLTQPVGKWEEEGEEEEGGRETEAVHAGVIVTVIVITSAYGSWERVSSQSQAKSPQYKQRVRHGYHRGGVA